MERLDLMKSLAARLLAAAVLAAMVILMLAAAIATNKILEPDKLIILSTTDVKGKNSPCG